MSDFDLAMDAGAIAGVAGYISGIAVEINTPAYIDAALTWTHSQLTMLLDVWIDGMAQHNPRELQHVYEWPTVYQNYDETVGRAQFRLWINTLTGRGRSKVASFKFLASKRPSPVNPQLTQSDNGRSVKTGVHIFVWKAPAMEYNYEITVEPKLARYLAYVFDDSRESKSGTDGGLSNVKQHKDGRTMAFSEGPVTFKAGGDVTFMRFTTLYQYYWSAIAAGEFNSRLAPKLARDIVDEEVMGKIIRQGNQKVKSGKITAMASKYTGNWEEAASIARAGLRAKENSYIEQARARRLMKYGDAGVQ